MLVSQPSQLLDLYTSVIARNSLLRSVSAESFFSDTLVVFL